jgi:membrane protein implicated in regulation of membrane protease activity
MTIPVALLFRVGELLGQSAGFSATGIGAWLTALVIPFAAVASPFVLFWQAGLILFVADRASRHVSAQRARERVSRGSQRARQAGRGGRNFVRGVRDEPAVRNDGQAVLGSGESRAHAAGKRVNRAGSRLGDTFDDSDGGGDSGGSGGSGGDSASPTSIGDSGGGDSPGGETPDADERQSRHRGLDNLRDTDRSSPSGSRRVDDEPRYLQ